MSSDDGKSDDGKSKVKRNDEKQLSLNDYLQSYNTAKDKSGNYTEQRATFNYSSEKRLFIANNCGIFKLRDMFAMFQFGHGEG